MKEPLFESELFLTSEFSMTNGGVADNSFRFRTANGKDDVAIKLDMPSLESMLGTFPFDKPLKITIEVAQ